MDLYEFQASQSSIVRPCPPPKKKRKRFLKFRSNMLLQPQRMNRFPVPVLGDWVVFTVLGALRFLLAFPCTYCLSSFLFLCLESFTSSFTGLHLHISLDTSQVLLLLDYMCVLDQNQILKLKIVILFCLVLFFILGADEAFSCYSSDPLSPCFRKCVLSCHLLPNSMCKEYKTDR